MLDEADIVELEEKVFFLFLLENERFFIFILYLFFLFFLFNIFKIL